MQVESHLKISKIPKTLNENELKPSNVQNTKDADF